MKMILFVVTLCFLPLNVWAHGYDIEPFEYFGIQFGDSYAKAAPRIAQLTYGVSQPGSTDYEATIKYGHSEAGYQGTCSTDFIFYKKMLVGISVTSRADFWSAYHLVGAMSPNESELSDFWGGKKAVFRIRKGLVITVTGEPGSNATITYSTKEFDAHEFLDSIGYDWRR